MRVAVVQHDIVWQDAAATRAHLEPMIATAAGTGARLVVLTEMFATGFSMQPERVAERRNGPTEQWLSERARAHDVWIIGSIAQWDEDPRAGEPGDGDRRDGDRGDGDRRDGDPRDGDRLDPVTATHRRRAVNVAVVAGPAGERHRYEKMHPFSFAGEHEHYRPGEKPLTVDVDGVRTSVLVCYDLRFAEDFWPLAHDTDLYVVVANWPQARREHWRTLLRARAIENQAYVVGANRVGRAGPAQAPAAAQATGPADRPGATQAPEADPPDHAGDSAIIDPLGRTLAEAAHVETVVWADVDPAVAAEVRSRFPFLADRR